VDVVNYVALLIECTLESWFTGLGVLELIAKICIGLLEILPNTCVAAASLADDEAEGGGYHHPYR
jgi:hypothetical protein